MTRDRESEVVETHHDLLHSILWSDPRDYDPWGTDIRWASPDEFYPDCSHGCAWFYELKARNKEILGMDWGVCGNPKSHRHGLLTFEHQGCREFEAKRKRKTKPLSSISLSPQEEKK